MELDVLKKKWSKADHNFPNVEDEHLRKMITARSKSRLAIIRRNLWVEIIASFLFFAIFFVFALQKENLTLKYLLLTALSILFCFTVYFCWIFFKTIKKINIHDSLRNSLKQIISQYGKAVQIYTKMTKSLYIFAFFTGLLLGMDSFFFEQIKTLESPKEIIFIAGTAVFFFIGWLVLKRYIHFMFGIHLTRLKENYRELIEINNNNL